MRLHELRIRAFGPFAGEERVDFDRLTNSGLFLLHGPTGAGKTSVLDAVCFALYGRVPGDRARVLGSLRSDHARDDVSPEVSCVFSVGPRRFEVTRSPQWERPKKRGSGTVTEQAKVRLVEFVNGEFVVLATRLDEAGDLVQQLLGLGVDQFTKLILLPQGDFAAFLRSDAESRRRLLEKLFATDRFAGVQRWLSDRRLDLWRDVSRARADSAALLARATQAVAPLGQLPVDAAHVGDTPTNADRADPGPSGVQDVRAMAAAVASVREEALATLERDARRRADAQETYSAAAILAKHQATFDALTRRAERLATEAPQRQAMAERRRAAQNARALAPFISELLEARASHTAAIQRVALVDPQPLSEEDLAGHVHRLTLSLGELDSVEVDARNLEQQAAAAAELADTVAHARAAAGECSIRHDSLVAQRAAAAEHLNVARILAAQEADRGVALAAARSREAAVASRDRLTGEVRSSSELVHELRADLLAAREVWNDLREARINGMAAELAHALVSGEPCRVCGSARHPRPASPAGLAVTEAHEAEARRGVDAAETALAAANDRHSGLCAKLAAATMLAGGASREDSAASVRDADAAYATANEAGATLELLASSLAVLDGEVTGCERREKDLRASIDVAGPELERLRATISALTERVDRARGDHPTVADRRSAIGLELERCARIGKLRAVAEQAARRIAQVEPTARAAATTAGFESLELATAALLEDEELARLDAQIAAYDNDAAAVTERLDDPELLAAAALPAAEVDAAAAQRQVAEVAFDASTRRSALAESAAAEIAQLCEQLMQHVELSSAIEAEYSLVDGLSRCADGSGGDNAKRMSLSSYVLAARLERVASAASDRLSRMSGGRYALVHTDERARGGGRSGLGLRIVDGWTGRQRETATLSGGETFYASLALALGMADVVTQEAGGLSLETLFIDEGFGSLDEDTLDEVMDVLDDLRTGGRVVGIVSHVPDLRTRLPQRLEVAKGRDGSHVRQNESAVGA